MNANIITQLSIFVNNAPGSLANVAKTLHECNINMKACNLAESTEFGILRAIVDEPEQAIAKLAPDDRELIRLFYYHKVKTDEIARRTGLTQSNVLVRLHRIRERLKKQIGNERDE